MQPESRRHFLRSATLSVAALLLPLRRAFGATLAQGRTAGPHPTPRTGITAARVLTRGQLSAKPELIPLFDSVRAIPQIVDGIRCNCGCAGNPGFYSLLSCYEGADAMALECRICQGQGKLAARLHAEGKSLDQIRTAVDARFG
jgi:hypothetical protein